MRLITCFYLQRLIHFGGRSSKADMINDNFPTPHNLLTPLQRAFIQVFSQLPDQQHFYLTGGTALAEYYLGHRLSYDLDFFTVNDGLVQPVSCQIEKLCKENNLKLDIIPRWVLRLKPWYPREPSCEDSV